MHFSLRTPVPLLLQGQSSSLANTNVINERKEDKNGYISYQLLPHFQSRRSHSIREEKNQRNLDALVPLSCAGYDLQQRICDAIQYGQTILEYWGRTHVSIAGCRFELPNRMSPEQTDAREGT